MPVRLFVQILAKLFSVCSVVKPEHFTAMICCCHAGAKISKLAAGAEHSIAVSAAGELFSWGSGSNGRLGHAQSSTRLWFWNKDQATPKLIQSMTEKVVNASCGHMHSGEVLQPAFATAVSQGKFDTGCSATACSMNIYFMMRCHIA